MNSRLRSINCRVMDVSLFPFPYQAMNSKEGRSALCAEVEAFAESRTAEIEGWEPFAWKHNALRHSFISYRLAAVQNTAQVALEAGNSPQMIFRHYRELVRPADAEKWFAVTSAS